MRSILLNVTDADRDALQQMGAVEGLDKEAKKIGEDIGKSASDVIRETAQALAMGKMSGDFNAVDRAGGADGYADIMGKTSRNQMSDKIGTNDEMVKAFNAMREVENAGRKLAGKQELPLYDNSSSTSQEAQADFDEFVRLQEQNKAAQKNAMAQAMGVLGDAGTALLAGGILNKATGNPIGKTGKWIWNKTGLGTFKNSMPNHPTDKSTTPHNNRDGKETSDTLKNQHNNTPEQKMSQAEQKIKELRSDRENYIKEEKKFQGLKDSEEKNLYNLETQRDKLEKNGKDTSKVDADIQTSKDKINQYEEERVKAEQNRKATDTRTRIARENYDAAKELQEKKDAKIAGAKGFVKSAAKGAGVGFAVDTAADELTQLALDGGNFRTANALSAVKNTTGAIFEAGYGGALTMLGFADKAAEYVTGHKPLGSLAAWSGLTNSNNLVQEGIKTVDNAGATAAKAMLNAQDLYEGTHSVVGRKQGQSTAMGELLGYGSLSQQTGSVSKHIDSS